MRMIPALLTTVLWIGTIDQIQGELATVEVTASDNKIRYMEMSTLVFPCEVKEQSMFYFIYSEGVTEIRCGEPPE